LNASRTLSLFDLLEAEGFHTYCRAAALFRLARSRGVSLTTTDAIIATIATENHAVVFSPDRDFVRMAQLGGTELYQVK
jgi:predicted nucleic acid-binding protein